MMNIIIISDILCDDEYNVLLLLLVIYCVMMNIIIISDILCDDEYNVLL